MAHNASGYGRRQVVGRVPPHEVVPHEVQGNRCPERHLLEFHHDEPYALGGDRSLDNLRLACSAHNAYMAELDYGKEKMDQYRRSADRVGEPQPTLELSPDKVA